MSRSRRRRTVRPDETTAPLIEPGDRAALWRLPRLAGRAPAPRHPRSRSAGAAHPAGRPGRGAPDRAAPAPRQPSPDRGVHDRRQCGGGRDAGARAGVPACTGSTTPPDAAKIEALREFVATLGFNLAKGPGAAARRCSPSCWSACKGSPFAEMVHELVLRSQSQAVYSPVNIGHFGLALRPLLPFHLADPPLFGPAGPSRPDRRLPARR